VSGAGGLAQGAAVVVVVRPEDLELSSTPAEPGVIAATVVDVAFLGAQRTVRLESPAVGDLVASTSGGARSVERGSAVGVTFRDEHSWAVPVMA
jgi:ABC-type Fe3+/spermidine/putrescine transport system ATPase subunit